jgi:hypothetical protein
MESVASAIACSHSSINKTFLHDRDIAESVHFELSTKLAVTTAKRQQGPCLVKCQGIVVMGNDKL